MTSNESGVTASWKRPWSLNEIISYSNNWSLAGDSGVCELLKRFSSDLITDVTQVNYNLCELQIENKQLNVVMENVSNDLCMLANDQFIENLVEEVHDSGYEKVTQDTIPSSKEDKGVHTISLVLQALHMGIQVLENQFDVIDVARMGSVSHNFGESDLESQTVPSTSDFPTNEPIYQPKDPYENRHLPHLIGTADFIQDDTLGIGYIDDIEEVAAMSEESASVASVSGPLRDFLTSSSDGELEDKPAVAIRTKRDNQGDNKSEVSDNMFEDKSRDLFNDDLDDEPSEDLFNEDLNKSHSKVNTLSGIGEVPESKPLTLTEQLNRQLKAKLSIGAKPSEVAAAVSEESLNVSNNNLVNEEVEEDKPTVVSANLWSNDGDADNDDDDDLDIFAVSTKHKSKVLPSLSKQPPTSSLNANAEANKNSSILAKESQAKVNNVKPSLPLENSDSDDDIFKLPKAVIQKQTPVAYSLVAESKKVEDSLPIDSDDMFEDASSKAKPLQNGTGLHSTPKANNVIQTDKKSASAAKKSTTVVNPFRFSSDDEEYDDLFATKKPEVIAPKATVAKPIAATRSSVTNDTKKKSLVKIHKTVSDSSDSDDIFNTVNPLVGGQKTVKNNSKLSSVDPLTQVSIVPATTVTSIKELPKKNDVKLSGNSDRSLVKEDIVEKTVLRQASSTEDIFNIVEAPKNTLVTKPMSDSSDSDGLFDWNVDKKRSVLPAIKTVNAPLGLEFTVSSNEPKKQHMVTKKSDSPFVAIQAEISVNKNENNSIITGVIDPEDDQTQLSNSNLTATQPLANYNNNTDELPTKPQQSNRRPIPGAVPSLGGLMSSSNNSSIFEEIHRRSMGTLQQNHVKDSSDGEANKKGEEPKRALGSDNAIVTVPRTFQLPMMHRAKEDSPVEESEISLDVPVQVVNQLTNLTKSRARVTSRRRPVTKKTDAREQDVPVAQSSVERPLEPKVVSPADTVERLSIESDDIFANLPMAEKKSKSKKREKVKQSVDIDVNEIDDIFAVTSTKSSTKKRTKKTKVVVVVDDPLGAM